MGKKTVTATKKVAEKTNKTMEPVKEIINSEEKKFMLPKKNLRLILIGMAIVIIGFLLMTGSKTDVQFNPNIYSFRRIVIAPVVSLAGFIFIIFAILHKEKTNEDKE